MRLLLLLLFCSSAFAQYDGPAVETCRAYAKRELERDGTRAKDVLFERNQNLSIERYTRKLGSQFVSSVLRGDAAVVLFDGVPSSELSFVCLLADDKRAVFFEWLPRPSVSALAQCTRDKGTATRPCLETLLSVAETDLTQSYAPRYQEARDLDGGTGKEVFIERFRKANDEWKQYRDAECARRSAQVPQGAAADDLHLACVVDLTRRRALDMR
jgi:uncharacterized protein YecT (DUF1311 family)